MDFISSPICLKDEMFYSCIYLYIYTILLNIASLKTHTHGQCVNFCRVRMLARVTPKISPHTNSVTHRNTNTHKQSDKAYTLAHAPKHDPSHKHVRVHLHSDTEKLFLAPGARERLLFYLNSNTTRVFLHSTWHEDFSRITHVCECGDFQSLLVIGENRTSQNCFQIRDYQPLYVECVLTLVFPFAVEQWLSSDFENVHVHGNKKRLRGEWNHGCEAFIKNKFVLIFNFLVRNQSRALTFYTKC